MPVAVPDGMHLVGRARASLSEMRAAMRRQAGEAFGHLPFTLEALGFERVEFVQVGPPAGPAAERWRTTVMFIDIVDSTRQAALLGDTRWLDLEEAYEALVRRQVRRFGGRVLLAAGDGLVAVFPSSGAGVRCAADIGRASRRLGLDVRAGLHAGECQRRGRRLGGLVFHIGARLAALASGGEVLVSHAVKALAGEPGLSFTARGVRRLRGVPGRWPVYAAEHAVSCPGVARDG